MIMLMEVMLLLLIFLYFPGFCNLSCLCVCDDRALNPCYDFVTMKTFLLVAKVQESGGGA